MGLSGRFNADTAGKSCESNSMAPNLRTVFGRALSRAIDKPRVVSSPRNKHQSMGLSTNGMLSTGPTKDIGSPISDDSQACTLSESLAELEIVPRPEVRESTSLDDLSDASSDDEEFEEIVTYNELLDHISKDETEEGLWKFKSISAHQGPLSQSHPAYNGSRYNVLVNWETGESTFEPLATIAADDPVTCAIYAKENGLLEEDGWRQFKKLARRQKRLDRMVNQAKLKSFQTTKSVYKFGYLVPRNHEQAVELDERNENTK